MFIELLERIRALSKAKGKKATAQSANYQDNITCPLSREYDDNVTANVDPEEVNTDMDLDPDSTDADICMLSAVERVSQTCSFIGIVHTKSMLYVL